MKTWTLEVCTDSVESALAAQEGGADRTELCASLVTGGITPGKKLFEQVRAYTDLKIRVLLRPRWGDFCYNRYEVEQMKEESRMFAELGADAIVTGVLTPEGNLDTETMEELIQAAGGTPIALHRAFDMCRDACQTLEEAAGLGICTILTSGQQVSAWAGRDLLKELQERSGGRTEILAGAGITPGILRELAEYTGIRAFHMSGKEVRDSRMKFRRPEVSMGLPGLGEYEIWQTSPERVRAAVRILEELDGERMENGGNRV